MAGELWKKEMKNPGGPLQLADLRAVGLCASASRVMLSGERASVRPKGAAHTLTWVQAARSTLCFAADCCQSNILVDLWPRELSTKLS